MTLCRDDVRVTDRCGQFVLSNPYHFGMIVMASVITITGAMPIFAPARSGIMSQTPAPVEHSDTAKYDRSVDFIKSVKVVLGDGREIVGKASLHAPEEFILEHISRGVRYQKKIRFQDIASIDIKQWTSKEIGKNKRGRVFDFNVSRFELVMKGGFRLQKEDDMFSFLKQIQLGNENGSTTLYTYWRDLQNEDGTWFTGVSGPDGSRISPHPDVVKRIEFID